MIGEVRHYIVSGGSSGIGRGVVEALLKDGSRVAVLDQTNAEQLERHSTRFFGCDVADHGTVAEAMNGAAEWLGSVDGVVSCAGVLGVLAPIEDTDPAEWRRCVAVNLDGAFNVISTSARHLRAGGRIVALTSIAGTVTYGTPGAAAYMSSKAGLAALVKVAAVEFGRYRITVNGVAPGYVPQTGFPLSFTDDRTVSLRHRRVADIPLAGSGVRVDDVVSAVRFLLGDGAAQITGAILPVDAGQSLMGSAVLKR
jgi:3-oxoacyl-[acyl-carrier protein] reductase